MPSIRIVIEDTATTTSGGLQWLLVINNVAGFLLLTLGTIYLLYLFLWPYFSHILHEYILLSDNHRPLTESDTSDSSADLSRAASPSPPSYTSPTSPLYIVRVPPSSQRQPLLHGRSRPCHMDEPMARG